MKTIKLDVRGGARTAKKLKLSQARMLSVLWDKFGGIKGTSDLLGVPYQNPINWRLRGFVPLELVGRTARKLGVSKEALNYEGVAGLCGTEFRWDAIVAINVPEAGLRKYILAGTHPRTEKEILADE
jgi:hypothetical protein